MIKIGKRNYLQIVQLVVHGAYLDGGSQGKILLPKKYLPRQFQEGDWLEVFIYYDSEDRLIATTQTPYVMIGEFARLKVIDVNKTGAFLDWGLDKDLLVPYQEQVVRLQVDKSYTVYVYLDSRTKRITATTKVDQHLQFENKNKYSPGQQVDVQIWRKTELGFMAIINNSHAGLIYDNEIFQKLNYGQKLKAFIKNIRDDDRIDLSLNRPAKKSYEELPDKILSYLQKHDGTSLITDKSSPEEIYATFSVSKANYKKALGRLYKERRILIEKDRIQLLKKE